MKGGVGSLFVFYFIESMIKAAVNQFAFSEELARDITLQVIKGSLAIIEQNEDLAIAQLRDNVTSKKGTTEQAINVFEKYNLMQIISEAERACYDRAKEISKVFAYNEYLRWAFGVALQCTKGGGGLFCKGGGGFG